jgi:hypothetical protein
MERNVQRAESILAILVSEYEEKVYFAHFDCTTLATIHSSARLRRSLPSPPLHNASHYQRSALSLLERDASSQAMRERTLESQADARADEVDRLLADSRQKRLALQRTLDAVASERCRHWIWVGVAFIALFFASGIVSP